MSRTKTWALASILFGCAIPVGAGVRALASQGASLSGSGIVELHRSSSVYWFIDAVALVWVISTFLIGCRSSRLERGLAAQTAQLASREILLDTLLAKVTDGIVICDTSGTIISVNEAAKEICQYDHYTLIGVRLRELLPDVYGEKFQDAIAKPGEIETRCRRSGRNQRFVPVVVSFSCVQTADGPIVVCALRDVTEAKRAEVQISKVRSRLQTLMAASPALLYSTKPDAEYTFNFVSENLCDLTGCLLYTSPSPRD